MYALIIGILSISVAAYFFLNSKNVKDSDIQSLSDEELMAISREQQSDSNKTGIKSSEKFKKQIALEIKKRGLNY